VAIAVPQPRTRRRTSAIAKSSDPGLEAFFAEDQKQSVIRGEELRRKIEELIESERERKLFYEVRDKRKAFVDTRAQIYALKKQGEMAAAEALLYNRFQPASDEYLGAVASFLAYQKDQIDKVGADVHATHERSRNILLSLIAVASLLSVSFAVALTLSIVRPIKLALETVTHVASGDLSRVPFVKYGSDEIGLLLRKVEEMRAALAQRITRVAQGTRAISVASNEIAQGNLDLSGRTETQAASLEETASTMEHINATVKETVASAQKATHVVAAAAEVTSRVGTNVKEITATMSSIDLSSKQISEIIGVIDGIAFQTNILALNAAVEAARAGEHGRGFAVVAAEVRNLAQRAAAAAKEIKGLILGSVEHVVAGGKMASNASATMDEMLASIKGVIGITTQIAQSSTEQARSIDQIHMAIRDMDAITQQNAALVEQAAAAAQSMDEQSQELLRLVAEFKLPTADGERVYHSLALATGRG